MGKFKIELHCQAGNFVYINQEKRMRRINLILLRKRFYLFIMIFLVGFMSNLYLWNETSRLIENIPNIISLNRKSTLNIYEFMYTPSADETGLIVENSQEEKEGIYAVLADNLYTENGESSLYYNKNAFIEKTNSTDPESVLKPFSLEKLGRLVDGNFDARIIDDLVVVGLSQDKVGIIENSLKEFNVEIDLLSLKESHEQQYDYYVGNFIFGLIMASLFVSFGLLVIYWLIGATLKILGQDIKVLRVVGVPKKRISRNFLLLLISPLFVSILLFVSFVYLIGRSILISDCIYLLILNSVFVCFAMVIIHKKMRGGLNA